MQNLLPKIATGDPGAVEDFLKRHTGMVWGLARRFCRNAEDAEDATQEIFVDVWKSAERYDPTVASETAFVATIARRRLIDRRRRAQRRPQAELLPETLESSDSPVDEQLALCDEAELAKRELERLKPDQQRVLRLSIWDGLSHSEIAEQTGMPLGTVKTHVRRGLLQIRESIAEARRKA